jgi:alpha-glucosidase
MGTYGSGPFDSDTAEDFLDELEEQPVSRRLAVVESTFRSAIEAGGGSNSSVLPEEVIAAAAVVAANIPAGSSLAWNGEYPSITEWLAKPITPTLASSAIQALDVALPADGWFWRSWVDASEREGAQDAIDSLRSVLRPVSEGESR